MSASLLIHKRCPVEHRPPYTRDAQWNTDPHTQEVPCGTLTLTRGTQWNTDPHTHAVLLNTCGLCFIWHLLIVYGVHAPLGTSMLQDSLTIDVPSLQIKTTAPLRYKVRPNLALIDPKSVARVHVLLVPSEFHLLCLIATGCNHYLCHLVFYFALCTHIKEP